MTNSINISTFEATQKTKGYELALKEAFNQLGPNEFISFVLKPRDKGKSNKKFQIVDNSEFWNEFLSDETLLKTLFRSKNGEKLFYWCFSNSEFVSKPLLERLVEINPERLVSLVRYSKLFLKEEKMEFLHELTLPAEYKNHQETWQYILIKDVELWGEINFNSWKEFPTSQFLANLINWLETKRFNDDSLTNLEQLARSYSFIISLFLSENYERCKCLSFEEMQDVFHASMLHPSPMLEKSFNTVFKWINFDNTVITPYCFDHNMIPVIKSESLRFEYVDQTEYRNWIINGERYSKNRDRYMKISSDIIAHLIREGSVKIPKGRIKGDQEINIELMIKSTATTQFLSDLHLEKIRINKRIFSTFDFVTPLMAYSVNRKIRYEMQLRNFSKESSSWQWAYYQLNERCRILDVDCNPYLMMTEKEYVKHNSQACHPNQAPIFEELINNFGYRITEKFIFNRHKIGYDVWYKPFIRIQDYIFCPMVFFANNEWFYSFAQIVLKNYQIGRNVDLRKESANKMEEHLLQYFQKCNADWKCLIPKFEHEGDIDLIIQDNVDSLIIQLKRTVFRTDLEQTYFESVHSDQKAAYQLNKGEAYLNANPDIYRLRKENKKYIVSTSFENIGSSVGNCLKVNYMELIWLLQNRQIGSLQQLDEILKRDEI